MKTKQQLIAEMNCAQKRLFRLLEELNKNREGLGADNIASARAHLAQAKKFVEIYAK